MLTNVDGNCWLENSIFFANLEESKVASVENGKD